MFDCWRVGNTDVTKVMCSQGMVIEGTIASVCVSVCVCACVCVCVLLLWSTSRNSSQTVEDSLSCYDFG
jgi:hypothetical protein